MRDEPRAKTILDSWFRDHPASVGETYREHLRSAASFGFRLVAAGIACTLHAVLPRLFPHHASDIVLGMNRELAARRVQRDDGA